MEGLKETVDLPERLAPWDCDPALVALETSVSDALPLTEGERVTLLVLETETMGALEAEAVPQKLPDGVLEAHGEGRRVVLGEPELEGVALKVGDSVGMTQAALKEEPVAEMVFAGQGNG